MHTRDPQEIHTDRPALYCHRCYYNLSGLTEPRCPECGTPIRLDVLALYGNDLAEAATPVSARDILALLAKTPGYFAAACIFGYLVGLTIQLIWDVPAIIIVTWLAHMVLLTVGWIFALAYAFAAALRIASRASWAACRPLYGLYFACVFTVWLGLFFATELLFMILPVFALTRLAGAA